jgi:sulfide:quinone oxidoreductase
MAAFSVVICGGGFAGIEALLRLRRLAGESVAVTLLTPEDNFVYRPLTVLVPFALGQVSRYPIQRISRDADARWLRDRLAWVDLTSRQLHTADGHKLEYDALLLAVGGHERKPERHVSIFSDRTYGQAYRKIVDGVQSGTISNLVLAEPAGPAWPVPLYELALLTAKDSYRAGAAVEIVVTTPYSGPLHSFGEEIGDVVRRLLREAGITVYTRTRMRVHGPQQVVLEPGGIELRPDRIVTLPTITGPNVRGIPGNAIDRFIPVDEYCRVRGTARNVFAAGDATDLPIKHGGLAAQQADLAAAGIAHLVGTAPRPAAWRPVIRGSLLTGGKPLYLNAYLIAGSGWKAEIHEQPPWQLDQAVVAEELGPYLAGLEPNVTPRTAE